MMGLSTCPECGASYPNFYSPAGSMHTFCDDCGWTNDPRHTGSNRRLGDAA